MPKYALCGLLIFLFSCGKKVDDLGVNKLFTKVPAEVSGITFENKILESEKLHYYKYQYIYIGGGVAAADFNNDGLEDLFFTSNIYHNKLYLNKGNFEFEDITLKAGIKKRTGFDTGVSVADVNNDGFLDIYINRAGWYQGDERLSNMLYINNGDLTFTEKASEYGLDDPNRSIASTFFDYDKDGDLDLYIANAPSDFALSGTLLDLNKFQKQKEKIAVSKSSDKLYRNNGNGTFEDVSETAGILPDLGFGLNAQVGDLNNDGWLDVYVSNDFIYPDFAYINNGDGTFSEGRNELFKHISYYSMGSDIADINNDGLSDLFVLDMSPEDYVRSKTTMSMMSIDRFQDMVDNDYHHQYMHNVMQLNNGNGTFSEIANMSGLAKTDWSWSSLIADFDLDGLNDIYVTNGVYRDVVDRDANNEINAYIKNNKANLTEKDFYEFTQKLPQQKLTNYFFKNGRNIQFENKSKDWADESPTFSNGAVYVDLDNDGDLDVVTNNLDENATVLKNNSIELNKGNYLRIKLKGATNNPFGVGAKVVLHTKKGDVLTRQLINSRGYLSSVSNTLHFGLNAQDSIEKLVVTWPDDKKQTLVNIKANQVLELNYSLSSKDVAKKTSETSKTLFTEEVFNFSHKEKEFNDFDIQLLLPHKLSQLGPAIAKADLNNDGVDEVFLGGAAGFSSQLLVSKNNTYKVVEVRDFENDKKHEDVGATFFDADNDGDLDLYVVSGSYEFGQDTALLEDRLYINNDNNSFKRSISSIPSIKNAGSIVVASDYDNDGDQDLFIGGRLIPGKYPYAPTSTLLINSNGKFTDKTNELAKELSNIGMVTTAKWGDIDNDKDLDLVVSGEWMGIEVFINNNGNLIKSTGFKNLSSHTGWWNRIVLEDVDNDNDLDIIAGNLGLNYKFHASKEKPFHIYTNDFDDNGTVDIMLAKNYKTKLVPVRGKSCTSQQMPYLKDKIKTYNDFANSNLQQIIGTSFGDAIHYEANEFRSGYFINENDSFKFIPFPIQAQTSPINSIVYHDFNNDGVKDLLLAGNNYTSEVETTRADAGIGAFLKGDVNGAFKYVNNAEVGFYANGDVRNALTLGNGDSKSVLVANNNGGYQLFKIND